jgi:hypothetical protein
MKYILFFLCIFFQPIILVHAQLDSLYEVFADHMEEDRGLYEILEQLLEKPVNINTADQEDLEIFPFLSTNQIDSILINRPFKKKSEIRKILGYKTYQLFRYFFSLKEEKPSVDVHISHRLKYPIEKSIGIKKKIYTGSPIENYNRIQIQKGNNLSAGILCQKDIGEEYLTDHIAGSVQWYDSKKRYKILLGSYQINFGQGIALSSPYLFINSAEAIIPLQFKHPAGRPFLSAMENQGFCGVYTGYHIRHNIQISGFYSNNLKDACIEKETGRVSGIEATGYHRNESEKDGQNILKERSYGFICTFFKTDLFFLALLINKTDYNPQIYFKSTTKLEYKIRDHIDLYSISYRKKYRNIIFYGEIASNEVNSFAHQHGFFISEEHWNFGIKWWNLPPEYESPFGRKVSNSSSFAQNERGIYIGISGQVHDRFQVNSYWNYQKDLWRTFFNPLPGWKQEYSLQANFKYDPVTNILLHYQYIHDLKYPAELNEHMFKYKNKIRVQIDRKISSRIQFKTRIEKIFIKYSYNFASKEGINLYHDICSDLSPSIKIIARFSSFKTADYESRIYEYENDLPGNFANYPLYGRGNKWYFLVKYNPWDNFCIWFKYRKIYFAHVESIGSENDKIESDTRQGISIQMNYNL